jgi:DNA-directed RNA polymerase subunit M/transcription elongation factor TFIIS
VLGDPDDEEMRFCDVCDNLLYVKQSPGDGGLIYQCNYCYSAYDAGDTTEPIVETDYRDDRAKYHHLLTPLVHEDPTLPRVDNVVCPNADCSRPSRAKGKVLYIKYDPANLRFLYSCSYCKAFWGPEELGVLKTQEAKTGRGAAEA